MNIAIDIRSLMEGRQSGVEEYTVQLIAAMLKVAPQHEYKLFYNCWRKIRLPDFPAGGYQVIGRRLPNKLLNAAQYILDWPPWDRLIKQADVFFVPNPRLLPLSPGLPYVVTAHDLSYERFPEFYSWRRRIWHRMIKPRELMNQAEKIIAVSQATADDVVAWYDIPRQRVKVIYSGVTSAEADLGLRPFKPELPKPYILYFGTLEPRKNVVSVVEAWSAIASKIPHYLVIAGTPGWLMKNVETAIQVSAYRQRIIKLGFVDQKVKLSLYAGADLFVYPSFYEGFGFPPLEAMLAGTPAIIANNSSLPEVVGQWATMVNPYDLAELALVMKEVLSNQKRVGEEVQQEIRNQFSWENCARQTINVLESTV